MQLKFVFYTPNRSGCVPREYGYGNFGHPIPAGKDTGYPRIHPCPTLPRVHYPGTPGYTRQVPVTGTGTGIPAVLALK